jgi:hypothetical protein
LSNSNFSVFHGDASPKVDSPKRVYVGIPLEKGRLLDAPPRKRDPWASPVNFCLISLKKLKIKNIKKETIHEIITQV